MTRTVDAVVIGAGPAGSAAAYWLATRGGDVALIERASFPRDKACGDILSRAAVKELRSMGLDGWLEQRAPDHEWSALFRTPAGRELERPIRTQGADGPRWLTIPRAEFDARLAQHAQAAGAELLERATCRGITTAGHQSVLAVGGLADRELTAQIVIVASGSSSRFTCGEARLVALRGYYQGSDEVDMRMDLDRRVLPGYAWQFPVPGGRYNIGYGTTRRKSEKIRLDRLLESSRLTQGKRRVGDVRGGLINTSFGRNPIHQHGLLYAGDAAGLVQPHLAEGIYPALRSGRLAAEHAARALEDGDMSSPALAGYTDAVHDAFDAELRFSRSVHWLLAHPNLVEGLAGLILAYHTRLRKTLAGYGQPVSRSD